MFALEARRAFHSIRSQGVKSWSVMLVGLLLAVMVVLLLQLSAALRVEASVPDIKFSAPGSAVNDDNWFSIYPQSVVERPTDTLQVAALDARLLGIIRQGQSALANIALDGKDDRLYREGDSLARGVTLEQIGVNHIVVRESGELRKIVFPSLKNKADQPLLSVQQKSVEAAPKKVKVQLKGTTLFNESGIAGFRLDALPDSLERLDIVRAGDVVVAVDGKQLASLAADQNAVGHLLQRDSLQVSILRNGSEMDVNVKSDVLKSLIR